MELTRRSFLASAAAATALPATGLASIAPTQIVAGVSDIRLLPDQFGLSRIWGYDNGAPGPEIRLRQGERLQRRLVNNLPAATSTHWHGIRISNAMDGVSGLTQDPIPSGRSFDYDFVAPDAGTFWYHAHNRSFEQVARGLHGALIVEEPDPIDIDREEVLIFDDWLVDPETSQLVEGFGAAHDLSHAGRIGNYITVNGAYAPRIGARQNERLRLRMINASNARIFELSLDELEGWIVALDGMPLARPSRLSDRIVIAPAQRVDLLVDVTAQPGSRAQILQHDRGETLPRVAFEIAGSQGSARRDEPDPLPPNTVQVPDLKRARPVDLLMEGGAMGGLRRALIGDRMASMQELAQSGIFWAFNGAVTGPQEPPLARISRGETVRMKISNDTAFPHAMHLHGMHFFEMDKGGDLAALRDTTLVSAGETREIAFVADNPGQWLLHCHMLSHAKAGMTTWVDVT